MTEKKKKEKYKFLSHCQLFVPLALEMVGVFGSDTLEFLTDLTRRIRLVTNESKAHTYLWQQISVTVQTGNAAAVLGTAKYDFYMTWKSNFIYYL